MSGQILSIDQGTSSSRAVLFDGEFQVIGSAQQEFPQIYPQPGWVEHDPEAIWQSVEQTVRATLQGRSRPSAIGITNQRETTLIWDRRTGECIANAIVWQDRRTAAECAALRERGLEPRVTASTGLKLDPYFSATKIAWLLDHVDGARQRAANGELAFGTIDSFLLWRLTGGRVHATDASNASRTMLFDIHRQVWNDELLELFNIPAALLPDVRDNACEFGETRCECLPDGIPILGMAGDQQAALIGQAGLEPGLTKSTYGTGLFAIANTGGTALSSKNQLLTTVAMRLDGRTSYGLEGSVFVAGSAMQWLRDELGIIASAGESEAIASETGIVSDVVVVPAFAGLGAPYWDADARGAVFGLTRGSGKNELVTATLQAVALQTRDLLDAMAEDGLRPSVIRVDGGMVRNDWFLQFLSDLIETPVERPENIESTVLGAGFLAGLQAGIVEGPHDIESNWQLNRRFEPQMDADQRAALISAWRNAVARVRSDFPA